MKIIQVLALVSPDNVYGGPATVALDQCKALQRAGHQVVLVAGATGFNSFPHEIEGVPVRLFPVRRTVPGTGFAGLSVPGLHRWLLRNASLADAVHVHLARDLTTLPVAAALLALGCPVYAQPHGMIDESDSSLARILDILLTKRVLRRSRRVFALTPSESRDLQAVAGDFIPVSVLPNGILVEKDPPSRRLNPEHPTVLFLARLASRKRPLVFTEAASQLISEFPFARFVLVGPDEGEGSAVEEMISRNGLSDRIKWVGPADRDKCDAYMRDADIYVLPSINEPFGMTVLEAMRAAVPVVITDTCELAPVIRDAGAGVVTGPSAAEVAQGIAGYLRDPAQRAADGQHAFVAVQREFSMGHVVDLLLQAYTSPTMNRAGAQRLPGEDEQES